MSVGPAEAQLGLQVGSTVLGFMGGNDRADAADNSAWDAYGATMGQLNAKDFQINNQATAQMSNRATMAAIDVARITNIASTNGVQGSSVDHLIGDALMQRDMDISGVVENANNQKLQVLEERKSAYAKARGRVNEAEAARPSILGTGLSIAAAGAQYYGKTNGTASS